MGLFDYFSSDARIERRRAACLKKLTNMYYQKNDRLAAAHAAAEMAAEGDTASIEVLLRRFEHLAPSTTIDREEKEYVHDLLVGLGDRAIEPVKSYVRSTGSPVYWALQVLDGLIGPEALGRFIVELLEQMDNDYWREPEKKIGIVQIAGEYPAPGMTAALESFLDDHAEQVRFNAVDSLVRCAGDDARSLLVKRLVDPDEDSIRLRKRIAEALAEHSWELGDDADAVAERLPDGWKIAGNRVVSA